MEKQQNVIDKIPRDILFQVLDNPYESMIIVDQDGRILFMSKSYEDFIPIPHEEAVGKHLTDVIPNGQLHKVIESGRAKIGATFTVDGQPRVIARIPLKKDGKTIGAYGKLMFWHADKVGELYQRINALHGRLQLFKDTLNEIYRSNYGFDNIIGNSPLIKHAKEIALQSALTDSPVLITGESGTGKEMFAHSIHRASKRRDRPFVSVNCSSIPKELVESELFGYEPGTFTGALRKGKIGKFELAETGTIFLDEIGDMPLNMQVKLMRVLQEKEIEKLGGKPRKIDFRLIAATNRNLEKMMEENTFRNDLYYRLNVVNIRLPPLRVMKEDLSMLVKHFIKEIRQVMPKEVRSISDEAMEIIMRHSWPGNIRELRNMLEGAMIRCRGTRIEAAHLPPGLDKPPCVRLAETISGDSLREQLDKAEKAIIKDALERAGENRSKASKMLGIHRTGLYQKMKKYGL
ncbi:MAG: sigma 54-interacting transcriptional regulator [Desulfarculus sp.]|nr:sigma 54-interacting transcriptional regulator [Pseudomonadota bacterium]MBU4600155.1 sigma 54-interacting transcriptional regulator [Pseudomonadota bacterium]MBV1715600.1 sigma 54-interacting transcriptional regulator [Desulfarculus sp.]MBV1738868.1 sigma 54-interacting transcriptional regulator [Desulfarculus sp.]MBV1750435.1 sigma 54-interacting transcriptional regulator [Desulfarculus sp.]